MHFYYCRKKAAKWFGLSLFLLAIGMISWCDSVGAESYSFLSKWGIPGFGVLGISVSVYRLLNLSPRVSLSAEGIVDHKTGETTRWEDIEDVRVWKRVREGQVAAEQDELIQSAVSLLVRTDGEPVECRIDVTELDTDAELIARAAISRHQIATFGISGAQPTDLPTKSMCPIESGFSEADQ